MNKHTTNHQQQQQQQHVSDDVFGMHPQQEDKPTFLASHANDLRRPGERVLMQLIRRTKSANAENLARRLLNRTPLTSSSRFTYSVHQGSEDVDLDIIRRDLTSGRCFAAGMRLVAGAWANLLLGDRFTPAGGAGFYGAGGGGGGGGGIVGGRGAKQVHELVYRRVTCTCLVCLVDAKTLEHSVGVGGTGGCGQLEKQRRQHEQVNGLLSSTADFHHQQVHGDNNDVRHSSNMSDVGEEMGCLSHRSRSDSVSNSQHSASASVRTSAEVLSHMATARRTPVHSAMANFVTVKELPSIGALESIGGRVCSKEVEIGSVIRLNYRASAKLKFTADIKELFGHLAYTGPISHEEVFRRVTTIGVRYYLYNKGKKERKVYIQGQLIRCPINVGVVKLGTQPMHLAELGATFCLYRRQIMSIYVGEIVLEGNSLGSFINTGIRYYIGFGEERGVRPVYPNKTLGKARRLGVNELLLHHHMVSDLVVRCL